MPADKPMNSMVMTRGWIKARNESLQLRKAVLCMDFPSLSATLPEGRENRLRNAETLGAKYMSKNKKADPDGSAFSIWIQTGLDGFGFRFAAFAFAHVRIKVQLANTDALRGNFDQFVVLDVS